MTLTTSRHGFDYFDREVLVGRYAERRKMANNTYAERIDEDRIGIRLHDTHVVIYHRDGSVELDTGGWFTVTTKDRINAWAPCRVWSERGEWRVDYHGTEYVYADHMRLHPDGTVTGVPTERALARQRARRQTTMREIKAFVDSITPEQIVYAWEHPDGDCFYCRPTTDGGFVDDGHDANSTCVRVHVRQRYFHAHLALRALTAKGYRDPVRVMQLIYGDARGGRVSETLRMSLARFLRQRLIEGAATR